MRRRLGLVVIAGAAVSVLAGTLVAGAAPARPVRGSAWGSARPGPAAAGFLEWLELDSPYVHVGDLACAPSGGCGVLYPSGAQMTATVARVTGTEWGVPSRFGSLPVSYWTRLGCSSAAGCLLSGTVITDHDQISRAVAVSEVRGTWGAVRQLPGLAVLDQGGNSRVSAESCSASGWCGVAGYYWPHSRDNRGNTALGFVAAERDGIWRRPRSVPGGVTAISCDPAGSCTATGAYRGSGQPFVASGAHGAWGQARPVPGAVSLPGSGLDAISCTAPGNCSAAGEYLTNGPQTPQIVTITQTDGTWGKLAILPETAPYHPVNGDQPETAITSLVCTAPGQCVLAGYHASDNFGEYDNIDQATPFIANQVNGTWASPQPVPGLARLNRGGDALLASVACGTAGNCAAGGYYSQAGCGVDSCTVRAFVVTEAAGVWGPAELVPGLAARTHGSSEVALTACWRSGRCSAIGVFHDRHGYHLFMSTR